MTARGMSAIASAMRKLLTFLAVSPVKVTGKKSAPVLAIEVR